MRLFVEALRKELWQQWRTGRVYVVGAVFVVFGLASPLLARFTPELLSSLEGAEQFAQLIPPPTAADALGQYIKNLTQFGFILAVLLGMGAVAGEKEKGTAALILSKPLPRWAFILSKFVAQGLVYVASFAVAAAGAYGYTLYLFGPLDVGDFLLINGLLTLWLLVFVAVSILGSTLGRTTGAAAGISLAGCVLLLILGSLPKIGSSMPGGLVGWAGALAVGQPVAVNGSALATSAGLILVCLVAATSLFEGQEL
ncbi:MAG: ABC transporter permease subunit [Chloroflexota bacterium]